MQEIYQEIRKTRQIVKQDEELNQENLIYLPQKLKPLSLQQYQNTSPDILLDIEEIFTNDLQTIIFGQSGFGKTIMARNIEKSILKIANDGSIIPLYISPQNNIKFDLKFILKQQLQLSSDQQLIRFEENVIQARVKVIVLIDDFDIFSLQNRDFLIDLRKSFLYPKCKFIYFANKQLISHEDYVKWAEAENEIGLLQYEIVKLNKRDVQDYFQKYFPWEKWIFGKDLSQGEHQKIIKQIFKKLKNNFNIHIILIKIIKLSQIVDDLEQEAGTAMTILKELKIIIKNQDFSFTRIKNSSFDNALFYECNFEGSQLDNVDISRCRFISCNLTNVKWQNMRKYELQFYIGNQEEVIFLTFTNDCQFLAVSFSNGRIELWHIKACKLIHQLNYDYDDVKALVFTSNKLQLVSGGFGNKIRIHSCQQAKLIRKQAKRNSISRDWFSLAYSLDGLILASTNDKQITLWNTKVGRLLSEFDCKSAIYSIEISPDGKLLASSHQDGTIQIWNIEEKRQQQVLLKKNFVWSMSFSHHSKYLAFGGDDCGVEVLDIASGKINESFIFDDDEGIAFIKISSDCKTLASGGHQGTVCLWALNEEDDDIQEEDEIQNEIDQISELFPISETDSEEESNHYLTELIKEWSVYIAPNYPNPQLISLQFLSKGENVISGNKKGMIKMHDIRDDYKSKFDLNLFQCVTFSQSGKLFATCGFKQIQIWDLDQGKLLTTLTQGKDSIIYQVTFSFDEKLIASFYSINIQVWRVKTGKLLFKIKGHDDTLNNIVFSPTELILAFCMDDSIHFWDVEKKIEIKKIINQNCISYQIVYSPCGKLLASCGGTSNVQIWNSKSGEQLKKISAEPSSVNCIAFSKDGKILASGQSNDKIVLWDVNTGSIIKNIQENSPIFGIKFSHDGKLLASRNLDFTISIWNIQTSTELIKIECFQDEVTSIDFSSDGNFAASAKDHSVHIWKIQEEILDSSKTQSKQNQERQVHINSTYRFIPYYSFARDFTFNAGQSTLTNSFIVSDKGFNLTRLFIQEGGRR